VLVHRAAQMGQATVVVGLELVAQDQDSGAGCGKVWN
jgi:hypothetical protein